MSLASRRGRLGLAMIVFAVAGLAIATYLAVTKLAGGIPVCGPLRGCETVNTSPYSELLGIPVALLGVMFSLVLVGSALRWWVAGDGRALRLAYGLGIAGLVFLVYLSYLELFVIHAVCVWCVGYAAVTVGGFVTSAAALRRA